MFADPFTAVMALILLAFVGTLAVFFRIARELEALRRSLRDIRESLQYYAVDAAQQNRDLAALAKELRNLSSGRETANKPAEDTLSDLLEKGLPNLAADPLVGGGGGSAARALGGRTEEEDFLRRLEPGTGKTSAS